MNSERVITEPSRLRTGVNALDSVLGGGFPTSPRRSSALNLGAENGLDAKAVNASDEFLGQRDDDARRASHVAESVLVLVLGHLADEFGAVGAQASDSVVDAFDCKHDAPEA